MFKVKVLTIGKCKESWLFEALSEYEKRLKGKLEIDWVLAKDDDHLQALAKQESFLVILDLQGKSFSSEEWAFKFCDLLKEQGSRLTFVIGGAEGIPKSLFKRPSFCWSLSPLTFTHQIIRLILVEQIYRALEIEKGTGYHK